MSLKSILVEINSINTNLHCKLVENENEKQMIRCNMNNAEEVAEFLQLFQEKTSTHWIVNGQLQNPEK